jgi:hypothetical protein
LDIKIGDLVKLKEKTRVYSGDPINIPGAPGIVVDIVEDDSGYMHAQVLLNEEKWWFFTNLLEVVNDV